MSDIEKKVQGAAMDSEALKPWAWAMFDVAFIGAAYWFMSWLFGVAPTLAGWAFAIAVSTAVGLSRLFWSFKLSRAKNAALQETER